MDEHEIGGIVGKPADRRAIRIVGHAIAGSESMTCVDETVRVRVAAEEDPIVLLWFQPRLVALGIRFGIGDVAAIDTQARELRWVRRVIGHGGGVAEAGQVDEAVRRDRARRRRGLKLDRAAVASACVAKSLIVKPSSTRMLEVVVEFRFVVLRLAFAPGSYLTAVPVFK